MVNNYVTVAHFCQKYCRESLFFSFHNLFTTVINTFLRTSSKRKANTHFGMKNCLVHFSMQTFILWINTNQEFYPYLICLQWCLSIFGEILFIQLHSQMIFKYSNFVLHILLWFQHFQFQK